MTIPFLSPSVPSSPPLPPCPLPRRRGGQPSNRNATRHGFYSRLHPSPLAKLAHAMDHDRQILAEGDPDALARAIPHLARQIDLLDHVSETLLDTGKTSLFVALIKQSLRGIHTSMRCKLLLHHYYQPFHDLHYVAEHALDLISYDFWEHRITRDGDSFRKGLKKNDLNSIPFSESLLPSFSGTGYPFISPRQWRILQPLIPPSQEPPSDSGRCRAKVRGRPPADPSEMLDAVFWKIAHHARWQDLPVGYPSMFTCRRYYQRIFRSGRLLKLYRALYKDLCTRGRIDLTVLVERGYFSITANRIVLRPGVPETWRMRTALLFMQPGYHMYRHLSREKEQERRSRFRFGSLVMDRLGRIRAVSTRHSPVRPLSRPLPHLPPLVRSQPIHNPKSSTIISCLLPDAIMDLTIQPSIEKNTQ